MSDISGMYPIIMALLSSLMFALTFICVRIGVKTATTTTALWITLFINVLFLWALSLMLYGAQFNQWWEWRYFFLSGMFAPLLGRMFQFQGMARLGANITTPLTLTHPVVSVLLAIAFLGEVITWLGFSGAMLVVIGSVIVGSEGGQQSTRTLARVPRRYLLLPLAASICYGISVVFRKMGIDLGTDAITAAAVTCTSSWFFASIYVLFSGQTSQIRCTRREMAFFVLAGIFSGLGPMLLYMALEREALVVIAPISATTPLFVLIVSWLLLRADELFTPKVLIGTVATVAGVILVSAYGIA